MTEPSDLQLANDCLRRATADVEAWLAVVEQRQLDRPKGDCEVNFGRTGLNVVAAAKDPLPSVRKLWLTLHLWLALTVGAVLASIGFTGSLLVFNDSLLKMEVDFDPYRGASAPV